MIRKKKQLQQNDWEIGSNLKTATKLAIVSWTGITENKVRAQTTQYETTRPTNAAERWQWPASNCEGPGEGSLETTDTQYTYRAKYVSRKPSRIYTYPQDLPWPSGPYAFTMHKSTKTVSVQIAQHCICLHESWWHMLMAVIHHFLFYVTNQSNSGNLNHSGTLLSKVNMNYAWTL